MRLTAALICCVFLPVPSVIAQIVYQSTPVALDDADPPTLSTPGEVIPGTEELQLGPGVELNGLNLTGALIGGFGKYDLRDASLRGTNLSSSRISASLLNADLSGADLTKASITGSLVGANLSGANLSASYLDVSFAGADLTGANLSSANISRQHLRRGPFVFTNLSGANLSGLRLAGISFSGSVLRQTDFSDSWIDNDVYFDGVDLRQAKLENARFKGANLLLTDVRQVDFSVTARSAFVFTGGVYDQFTIFQPPGFDPQAAGMTYLPAIPGDTNLDDRVDFADFIIIAERFDSTCESSLLACWQGGDFNEDGHTNFADFLLHAENFGESNKVKVVGVPEPRLFYLACLCLPCVSRLRVSRLTRRGSV